MVLIKNKCLRSWFDSLTGEIKNLERFTIFPQVTMLQLKRQEKKQLFQLERIKKLFILRKIIN